MRYRKLVLDEPTGNPVPFLGVRVKRKSDGVTLDSLVTDANGFVTYEASGHAEPFYFETTNTIGGPRFWLSDETMPAGSFSPAELPAGPGRAHPPGVVAGATS